MHRLPWWLFLFAALAAPFAIDIAIARLAEPVPAGWFHSHALELRVVGVTACLLFGAASVAARVRRHRALRPARSLEALARIDWSAFEELVAELFRRRGYRASRTPAGADGGVDIIVESSHERAIVQAKHWPGRTVGAPVAREIYALVEDFDADRAIVATSGRFSASAHRFAQGKPLELMDGQDLVAAARRKRYTAPPEHETGDVVETEPGDAQPQVAMRTMTCPHCQTTINISES